MNTNVKNSNIAWLEIQFAGLMIIIGSALPLLLVNFDQLKTQFPLWGLEVVAGLGLGLQFLIYLKNTSRRPLRAYLLLSVFISALLVIVAIN